MRRRCRRRWRIASRRRSRTVMQAIAALALNTSLVHGSVFCWWSLLRRVIEVSIFSPALRLHSGVFHRSRVVHIGAIVMMSLLKCCIHIPFRVTGSTRPPRSLLRPRGRQVLSVLFVPETSRLSCCVRSSLRHSCSGALPDPLCRPVHDLRMRSIRYSATVRRPRAGVRRGHELYTSFRRAGTGELAMSWTGTPRRRGIADTARRTARPPHFRVVLHPRPLLVIAALSSLLMCSLLISSRRSVCRLGIQTCCMYCLAESAGRICSPAPRTV